MPATWIKNGRIIDPKNNRDETGDLFIVDGKISARPAQDILDTAEVIDASGLVVCPGLVDLHVHFRVPGQSHKETIRSGTSAAAAGGFTSVVCMPNTSPAVDSAGTVQLIKDVVHREAVVNVFPTGTITVGREGEALAPTGSLASSGIVAITDGGKCVQNAGLMRRAVQYAHMFDIPVIDHCQDYSLSGDGVMNEGLVSAKLGLRGLPKAAEDMIVSRDVILSTHTGAHIHLQHVSSKTAVEIIRRAKARGINVTAEVTPHHISLTDAEVESFNTNFKMNPPLRSEEDRIALLQALEDGTIDCIATGHAPHTDYEKDVEFDYAPFGVIGLETALSLTLAQLYRSERLSLIGALSLLTHRPAEILKLKKGTLSEGADADVTLFDLDETWVPQDKKFFSKSSNSPWIGQELTGKVKTTIVAGRVVFDGTRILAD
ncbi:dihydroorotase [Pelagicoccus sp. SDUM812003]|uniref:dihydroorotase n=1 Tax=Pelagicoccus sp. SDUM812003 TaxID=3041267 RepID=UPI00281071BD|nr:dihydroorotase [Pelagicoccus sp. SDUM812003]MDQ8201851.1 dihydroorotase [Pelagicoccus sp. SDUM812003]